MVTAPNGQQHRFELHPGSDEKSRKSRKERKQALAKFRNGASAAIDRTRGITAGEVRRLARNRLSARRARERQKVELGRLKSSVTGLQEREVKLKVVPRPQRNGLPTFV